MWYWIYFSWIIIQNVISINNQEFLGKFLNILNVLCNVFNDYFQRLNIFTIEFNKNISNSETGFLWYGLTFQNNIY